MKKTAVLDELNNTNKETRFEFVGFGITKFFTVLKLSDSELCLNAFVTPAYNIVVENIDDLKKTISSMNDNFYLINNSDTGEAGIFPDFKSVKYDSENNTIQFS